MYGAVQNVIRIGAHKSESMKHGSNPESEGNMRAVTWQGAKSLKVEDVPKPMIEHGTDAIVKVTACSICPGSATQAYMGEMPGMSKGQIVGREGVGIVHKVGPNVSKIKPGDRVAISYVAACGNCSQCRRGNFSCCNNTNESKEFAQMYGGWAPAAIFGGSRLQGDLPGVHAEFVRVPFADVNLYPIPETVPDEKAVFGTMTVASGLHATELGCVQKDDTVVIWGLGPIGLMSAQWSLIKGAKRVIAVDMMKDRLNLAREKFKIEVVDREDMNSTQVIEKLQGMLPAGGADVCIDAAGFMYTESWKMKLEKMVGMEKHSGDILKECCMVVRKCGTVAVIADYVGYADAFPVGHVAMKQLTIRAGQTPTQKYYKKVFCALDSGEIDPSVMMTHKIGLSGVPEAYAHLANHDQGYLKFLVRPQED